MGVRVRRWDWAKWDRTALTDVRLSDSLSVTTVSSHLISCLVLVTASQCRSHRPQLLSCTGHVLSDDVIHLYHMTFRCHVTNEFLYTAHRSVSK